MMAVVAYSTAPPSANSLDCRFISSFCNPTSLFSVAFPAHRRPITVASHLCTQETLTIDKSAFNLAEAVSEDQLWATACLRVSSFHDFQHTFAKEGRGRASEEFLASMLLFHYHKLQPFQMIYAVNFSDNGEDRVVVGTLDLNQCLRLPDEIIGMKPKGIGADFARAYLSNVCVAKELHRNGLGYALVAKSKMVAENWGISDLYVHVAVNNEPAKNLYMKSGFIYENDEPAWQARFLDRPRRILLWFGLPHTYDF
ncbi:GCN5-related N-acetyltransferase 7, chloroplastic isoform X2 [Cornus florida]|uniref:GCN5-related N-acetyltransferase 7, chloroplastic isoform X2 n=1 Tax=Cornus florida TaxID=4283 RepID=UPI002898C503|nr:GCN5-related N-acetyltransferase 7, chloroplastic isoform X2 [Cornus florida]